MRFAIGLSLIAGSVIGSAGAHSPEKLAQVSGEEALTTALVSHRSRAGGFSQDRGLFEIPIQDAKVQILTPWLGSLGELQSKMQRFEARRPNRPARL